MQRLLIVILMLSCGRSAAASTIIDLSGSGWTFTTTMEQAPHPVSVPHCWLVEKAYENYLGHALYQREFSLPAVAPGKIVRLHFDAVYEHATVWVNGRRAGGHVGGYSAFEFDITPLLLPGRNHIVVDVDNTPTLDSIPSLATSVPSTTQTWLGYAADPKIVGWLPYGGIVRPVRLIVSDPVYFRTVKVDALPDLAAGTATVRVRASLHNGGATPASVQITGQVANLPTGFRTSRVPAGGDADVTWSTTLRHAHLWSVRDPFLYDARLHLGDNDFTAHIGVRRIEVQGTRLLLNGREVHLSGANRVVDDPEAGITENDAIVERDLGDMLADNMRMMRISHYPQAQAVLDFADRHGMLLIPEAGNWNMGAWQMADPEVRARFQHDQREMMEQDWNHPSVIAWSVGNEYESYRKEGIDWTRDMRAYTLSLDNTRLITFASRYTSDPAVKSGKDEASQYSDFVSINVYGGYAKRFDRAHELYPDKPIFVTEFGKSGEAGVHDPQRIADITEAMTALKSRPYMIGASLWAWNDYRSLIRGTPADGIRRWGVVNVERERRDSWKLVQKLFEADLP